MRAGRSGSRQSFTVEVKSGERGATIPNRVPTATVPAPRAFAPPSAEPSAPAAETRRILPNLIAREPQAEPAADEISPSRKRGRPRKVQPTAAEPIATAAEAEPDTSPPAAALPTTSARAAPRRPTARPGKGLPAGERWKRRLGRWCR